MKFDSSSRYQESKMSNNRAGAVVERARQAEESLVIRLDMKAGNPVSVGEGKPKRKHLSIAEMIEAFIDMGFTVRAHNHAKTRARWLNG